MDTFEITKDALKMAWGGDAQYWFSLSQNRVCNAYDLPREERDSYNVSDSVYYLSLGYIPYLRVSNEEVMRAYVDTINNKKLKSVLSKVESERYVETFWKYCNVYDALADGYSAFEEKYVLNKAKRWCEDNAIQYKIVLI